MTDDEIEFEDQKEAESPFHIEVDLYDTGDYSRLLVIPCNSTYIVTHNDEHLCTLIHTCTEVECWEQEDGNLDDDMVELIGAAIKSYSPEY